MSGSVRFRRRSRLAAAAVLLASALVSQAHGQSGTDSQAQRDFEATFSRMLQDPANLDVTFRYAELAVQVGDFEAAISALERMLLYNPNLPRGRLELGRVAVFLDEIDKRLSNHRFAASVYGGMRYQTNANAGPKAPDITLLGGQATLNGRFTEKKDWNAFISGTLRHTYDPQLQGGEVMETDLLLYGSQQTSQHQLDLVFTELKTGPRARFMRDWFETASYAVASMVHLDESPYFWSYGIGSSFDATVAEATNGSLDISAKDRAFRADAGRPTARNQSGPEYQATLDLRRQLSDSLLLSGTLGWKEIDARQSLHSNREWEFGTRPSISRPTPPSTPTAIGAMPKSASPCSPPSPSPGNGPSPQHSSAPSSIPTSRTSPTPTAHSPSEHPSASETARGPLPWRMKPASDVGSPPPSIHRPPANRPADHYA